MMLQMHTSYWFGYTFVCLVSITPEGFTTMVANKGLEKARAWSPGTGSLTFPLKTTKVILPLNFGVRGDCTLKRTLGL